MTISSRNILLLVLAAALPLSATAQPQSQPAKAAAPVKSAAPAPVARPVINTPSHAQQFQRQVDRQQVINQQNQNAVQQQLRQNNMNQQRSTATDPALRSQLDNADRAQQQSYQAQQDASVRRAQADPRVRDAAQRATPASSGSAGH